MVAPLKVIDPSSRGDIHQRGDLLLLFSQGPSLIESLDLLTRVVSGEIPGLEIEMRYTAVPDETSRDPAAAKLFDRGFIARRRHRRSRQATALLLRIDASMATRTRQRKTGSVAGSKRRFSIDTVLRRIRVAVAAHADAAMFELAERGYATVFQQLVACVISIRTRDEVSLPVSIRLLERASTPAAMAALSVRQIDALIHESSFHEGKAAQIREIARRTTDEFDGALPCDFDVLTSFRGVGPKCANLTMGVACGAERISVDIHVHRVTNRWGYISASSPEGTMRALEAKLPRKYWIEINRLLVPFGKHICTGQLPRCSTCPVLDYCRQVGVTSHR